MQVLTFNEIQHVSGAACSWHEFARTTVASTVGGAATGLVIGAVGYGSICWW